MSVSEQKSVLLQHRTDNVLPDFLKLTLEIYEIVLVIIFLPPVQRAVSSLPKHGANSQQPPRFLADQGLQPQTPLQLMLLGSFEVFLTRDPKAFLAPPLRVTWM